MGAEPRLSDMMFETASERLLGVPIFSRGQLVGFIDIRDKQGKQPFEQPDAAKGQSIGERVLSLLTTKNVWNQKFITLADGPGSVQSPLRPRDARRRRRRRSSRQRVRWRRRWGRRWIVSGLLPAPTCDSRRPLSR